MGPIEGPSDGQLISLLVFAFVGGISTIAVVGYGIVWLVTHVSIKI